MNAPKMPTRGDRGAPKFIGEPDDLPRFFADVERVANGVGLSDRELMMWSCRYAQRITDEELWKTSPAFCSPDGTWEMFKKHASMMTKYPFEGYPAQTSSEDLVPRVYTQGSRRIPPPPKYVEEERKEEGAEDYRSPPRPPFQFRHITRHPREDRIVIEKKPTQQSKSTSNRTRSLSKGIREGPRSVSTPERPSPLEKPRREGQSQGPASPQSPTHTSRTLASHRQDEERAGGPGTTSMPVSPVPSPKVHTTMKEQTRVQRKHARNLEPTRTVEFKVIVTAPGNDSVVAQDTVIHTGTSPGVFLKPPLYRRWGIQRRIR